MNTMTQKQIDFINRLKDEKDCTGDREDAALADLRSLYSAGQATRAQASVVIGILLEAPRKADADPEAGVYYSEESGFYIRVYFGQESGVMLAKQVSFNEGAVSYAYLGAASKHVTPDYRRCTLEEVGALGKFSGTCAHCGRRLDDPESVDRGIGPICAGKY